MMISVTDALRIIDKAIAPMPVINVSLVDAVNMTLAEAVFSKVTQPPFDASAMDGYAIRADGISTSNALKITGTSAAGDRFKGEVKLGEAVRIFTGAPMPDGADSVVIQENTSRQGDKLIVNISPNRKDHIRSAGIDFKQGEKLLDVGRNLDGPAIALAAAANHDKLPVFRRPRIALIANGDELVLPGKIPTPDQIICSIPFGLAPLITKWGGQPEFLGVAPDDPAKIGRIIENAKNYDLIVPIGGASVGERDFMRRAFSDLGFEFLFEKVAVKPGKPTWFGTLGSAHVLGLPGNPASSIVSSILFLKPIIEHYTNKNIKSVERFLSATIGTPLEKNGQRENYLRAHSDYDQAGRLVIYPQNKQDSSLLSPFAKSDALLRRLPGAPALTVGDKIDFIKY